MRVLVVVDMQNDFVTGILGTPEAVAIVPAVKEKIDKYRVNVDKVLFTKDAHSESTYKRTIEGEKVPLHCISYQSGSNIIPELDNINNEVFSKETFLHLSLGRHINEIKKNYAGPFEIEVCGVCTDICVISNVLSLRAEFPETRIIVDAKCCAGTTPEMHQAALDVMKSCCIDVINEDTEEEPDKEFDSDEV